MDVTVREAASADGEDLLPLWRRFAAHLSAFDRRYAARDDAGERWLSHFEERLVGSSEGVLLVAEVGGDGGEDARDDGVRGTGDDESDGTGTDSGGAGDAEYVGILEARIEDGHPLFRLGRHGRIDGLYVREDVRNRGVGRALLSAAEAWFGAEPRGVDFYRVEAVAADDETAAALRGLDLTPVARTYEGES